MISAWAVGSPSASRRLLPRPITFPSGSKITAPTGTSPSGVGTSVLLEGGETLISLAFGENVIDGGEIFIANKILGDSSAKPFISGFVREKMDEAVQLTNVRNNIYGENVGMEFYFKKYSEMEQD